MFTDSEEMQLFINKMETNNCIKLKENKPMHTQEYRDLVMKEIKLYEEKLVLIDSFK